jgi:hypothetical protein
MAQINTFPSLSALIKERAWNLPLAAEMSLNRPTGEQKRITIGHQGDALSGLFLHACLRLSNHKRAHLSLNTTKNSTSPRNFEMIRIFDKSFLTN